MAMTRDEIIRALAAVITDGSDAMPSGTFTWDPIEDVFTVPMSDGTTVHVRGEVVKLFAKPSSGEETKR
jgi:hypothetical protein